MSPLPVPVEEDPLPDPLVELKVYKFGKHQALVKLTGPCLPIQDRRPGIDLVVVLDVSKSMMYHGKLDKVKEAMKFLIETEGLLTSKDRLAIVIFSDEAKMLPGTNHFIELATEEERKYLMSKVSELSVKHDTNIRDGLKLALKLLKDRSKDTGEFPTANRPAAVWLLSDGLQNKGGDAAQLHLDDQPIDTFGFGADHDPKVLNKIARKSPGGTFNYIRVLDGEDTLVKAFARTLAGIHFSLIRDLKLTVKLQNMKGEAKKELKVHAGGYHHETNSNGSVTVKFGYLYCKEERKVVVELDPPAAERKHGIIYVKYEYNWWVPTTKDGYFFLKPRAYAVWVPTSTLPRMEDELAEQARRSYLTSLAVALDHAEKGGGEHLEVAQSKLAEAKDALLEAVSALEEQGEAAPHLDLQAANKLVSELRDEVEKLQELMSQEELYHKEGRPNALAAQTSHLNQRFAARGDPTLTPYETPAMENYGRLADEFVQAKEEEEPAELAEEEEEDEVEQAE